MHAFVHATLRLPLDPDSPPEGRLDELRTTVAGEPGLMLLDLREEDASAIVLTAVGPGDAVRRASLRVLKSLASDSVAGARIDLEPFGKTPLEECEALATRLASQIASKRAAEVPVAVRTADPEAARAVRDRVEESGAGTFEARLGSAFPVPGGGAAAARCGRLATALVLKVIRISMRAKSSRSIRADLETALGIAERVDGVLEQLEDHDQRGFFSLLEAMRLPRSTTNRDSAIARGARSAISAPSATLRVIVELMRLVETLVEHAKQGRLRAESDIAAAIEMARAAFASSHWNVRVNEPLLADDSERESIQAERTELASAFESLYESLRDALESLI